jgi:hypothetical protein
MIDHIPSRPLPPRADRRQSAEFPPADYNRGPASAPTQRTEVRREIRSVRGNRMECRRNPDLRNLRGREIARKTLMCWLVP